MMNPNATDFNSGAIQPVECLKQGWAMIKDQYWLFVGMSLVALLIGSAVPLGILMGPMMCGLYLCLLGKLRGEQIQFERLFKGFDYFVHGLVAALIQTVPVIFVMLLSYVFFFAFTIATLPRDRYARDQGPPVGFFIGLMLFVIIIVSVSLIIHSLFLFAYPLIVDRKLSGWDAIRTSARAATNNIGGLVGLILLNFCLGIAGALACYVGVIFILPISFAGYAVAYRQVFPEIPTFGSPLPPPPPASWA